MTIASHNFFFLDNGFGWELELKQCLPPKKVHPNRNPILIIPGYGMNNFIFGFHPHGLSMEEYLRNHGFEVWSINLRGQGGSKKKTGDNNYGLHDLAMIDLKTAVEFVAQNSKSKTGKVDLIGCSLGGTLSFIYSALCQDNKTGSIVAIGSPLRWEEVHWLLRILFFFPELVGKIKISNTKEALNWLYPLLVRSPLLKLYLHKEIVDLRWKDMLLETVENPNSNLNMQIAAWMKKKDLFLDGINVTKEFKKFKNPLMCVVANGDGIVPALTALSAHEIASSKIKETLVVGDDKLRFAHADLFISQHSHERVFKPLAEWLIKVGRKKSVPSKKGKLRVVSTR